MKIQTCIHSAQIPVMTYSLIFVHKISNKASTKKQSKTGSDTGSHMTRTDPACTSVQSLTYFPSFVVV